MSGRQQEASEEPAEHDARALYRIALEDSAWSPEKIRRERHWRQEELEAAMSQLRRLRLFEPCDSTPSGVLALSPRTALAMLQDDTVSYVESALEVVRRASQATVDVVADLCGLTPQGPSGVRLVEGDEHASALAAKLLGSVRRELVALCDVAALSDGYMKEVWSAPAAHVVPRIICHLPPARPYRSLLDAMPLSRAEVRVAAPAPFSLTVLDRSFAMIPLPVDENHCAGLLVIEDAPLIAWLQRVFTHFWAVSTALPAAGHCHDVTGAGPVADPPAPLAGLLPGGDVDRPLLQLLAAGLTDKSISRRLGIHERTVRRRVSHLLTALGAESRFQGGVRAVRAGWLAG